MTASWQDAPERRYRRSRWPLDFPTIVVVLMFFGACWPAASPRANVVRHAAPTRFLQLSGPALSQDTRDALRAFMRGPDATPPPGTESDVTTGETVPAPTPRYLPRVTGSAVVTRPQDPDPRVEAAQRMRGYHPVWSQDDPFQTVTDAALRFVVEFSTPLNSCGFRLPDGWMRGLDGGDTPWDLTVDVRCGEDGNLRDTFHAEDSALTTVQREIMRRMFQGSAPAGPPCAGTVTVRWVRMPEAAGGDDDEGRSL